MADATITASSVTKTNNTVIQIGTAGATITAGQVLYIDTANNYVMKPAVATVQASAVVAGVALHGALNGQPIAYATGGDINISTLAQGVVYVASANAGGLAPSADLDLTNNTNYASIVGVSLGTTSLRLSIANSNVLQTP